MFCRTTSRLAILIASVVVASCGSVPGSYVDQEISGPTTLTSQWLELTPTDPMRVVRDTHEITLFPDPPIKMIDDPAGKRSLIPEDGREADIEAELVDGNGKIYHSQPGLSETATGDWKVVTRS